MFFSVTMGSEMRLVETFPGHATEQKVNNTATTSKKYQHMSGKI